jgi:hypothetical protein
MFGFQAGEKPDVTARKAGYRKLAQERWDFLTHYDLSTIKTEAQLAAMVQGRTSLPKAQAESDVRGWMVGKHFQST